jgi:DNA-directed RNA polymerase subunit RPC12/RpoP
MSSGIATGYERPAENSWLRDTGPTHPAHEFNPAHHERSHMGLLDGLRGLVVPDRERAVHYRCMHCERTFAYRADVSDPACPYCDSTSLEEVKPP